MLALQRSVDSRCAITAPRGVRPRTGIGAAYGLGAVSGPPERGPQKESFSSHLEQKKRQTLNEQKGSSMKQASCSAIDLPGAGTLPNGANNCASSAISAGLVSRPNCSRLVYGLGFRVASQISNMELHVSVTGPLRWSALRAQPQTPRLSGLMGLTPPTGRTGVGVV